MPSSPPPDSPKSRLQHSPSLPNIWLPPHSRPSRMATVPTSPQGNSDPSTPAAPQTEGPHKLSLKADDTRRISIKATPTRRRQRGDREPSQHLLTPPLTPSSSIKTTASADSIDARLGDKVHVLQELHEPEATRFLHLENVSRAISPTIVQRAVTDALGPISSRRNSKCTPQADPVNAGVQETSCIKGFFLRHMKATGTLFLAFHDVRDAITAKAVLSQSTDGVLVACVGEETVTDGKKAGFQCRFITAEELVKTIGSSNFLTTTDGSFVLSVTVIDRAAAEETDSQNTGLAQEDFDAYILVKILQSYGDLRLFKPESPKGGDQRFSVEFFDVRDANEAYGSLNSQTMFGMKLTTLGRVPADDALDVPHDKTCQERSDTPLSNHQQSASESHIPKLKLEASALGEVSKMRGRSVGRTPRTRPRAVSAGNETSSSSPPPRTSDRPAKAPSPAIFYTSFDFNDSSSTPTQEVSETPVDDVASELNLAPKQWEAQQTCSIAECRYCPSKGHDSLVLQPQFNHFNPPFANSVLYPVQSTPQIFTAPGDYDAQASFTNVGWPFDPNMLAPGSGCNLEMFTPAFIPAIPVVPAEHRYPDQAPCPNLIPTELVFPSISPALHAHSNTFVEHQPPPDHKIFISNPTEAPLSSDLDGSLRLTTAASSINDRNFLNIARIEEGLDTRSTVMIKNIPNKMTAKDLIQYINDVCPRKIDFLYLRMDFKNGCNVGYAFVNFIRVQDMLRFAKRRLGVKWNMFSSEKVLQMSYANYQGKEALVEKFKNSCIMDEREEWRPKIFYSNGPEQGLPEPFPAPTHLRRKERSSHNRGALYVPGITGGSVNGNGYLTNGPLRRHDFHSNTASKYLENRNRGLLSGLENRSLDRRANNVHHDGRRGRAFQDRTH
ncbi:hypothetical protein AGABI2DRAFT_192701 [Agaricus bisporus var. bisporus H97]|uniref:hypothetical protein n=1 Tax=Agaricus bisporus var. bisporus (strain H97 / ATCC MYA-4626 / FGSC 10389) TaxID=936046 RepID=UPI00029F6A96|nr:hypothetical protein AGABI2DRAFT_192701 [Agaricus bisporus var. bisporus H97]EKV47520.1 hypothetical protein AGABI2DRAFT_192701 [Agaricus bisporus var. bisporus H97]